MRDGGSLPSFPHSLYRFSASFPLQQISQRWNGFILQRLQRIVQEVLEASLDLIVGWEMCMNFSSSAARQA